MIYNTTQWNSVFDKGPSRKVLWFHSGQVNYTYNKWNVRLGRWGGSKGAWTQIMNNMPHCMIMVF